MRTILCSIGIAACVGGCAPQGETAATSKVEQALTISKQTIALSTGITMAYMELGNTTGEPVIFLHGYTDTARSFAPTVDTLLAQRPDLHIFVLDQRGHGASSMPPAATCAAAPEQCFRPIDMATDAIAFMDAKGITKASFVGHSMGSFVAQELGLSYPNRVDKLVLIGTSAKLAGNIVLQDYILAEPIEGSWKAGFEGQGYTFPAGVYDLTPLDANADAESWIAGGWVVDPAANSGFLGEILPETSATKMGTWIGAARALAAIDNRARLENLAAPTLILWATQDAFFYDTDEAELRAALDPAVAACRMSYVFKQYGKRPISEWGIQIDDIGHNTQWGAPNAAAADIESFLRHAKPTNAWYYSADGDPQTIVSVPGKAPTITNKANHGCP